jgi:predicted nucleic acid-binding Zn ribbon protein
MKKPTAVSHLLEQGEGMLKRLRQGTADADRALIALRQVLPAEIAEQVFSATLRGTTLTAFVPTAAWGTRLRYVAPKLASGLGMALGVPVEEIKVKVRAAPRRGQSPSATGPQQLK